MELLTATWQGCAWSCWVGRWVSRVTLTSGVASSQGFGLVPVMELGEGGEVRRHSWLSCHQVQVVWADERSQVRVVGGDAESGTPCPRCVC